MTGCTCGCLNQSNCSTLCFQLACYNFSRNCVIDQMVHANLVDYVRSWFARFWKWFGECLRKQLARFLCTFLDTNKAWKSSVATTLLFGFLNANEVIHKESSQKVSVCHGRRTMFFCAHLSYITGNRTPIYHQFTRRDNCRSIKLVPIHAPTLSRSEQRMILGSMQHIHCCKTIMKVTVPLTSLIVGCPKIHCNFF